MQPVLSVLVEWLEQGCHKRSWLTVFWRPASGSRRGQQPCICKLETKRGKGWGTNYTCRDGGSEVCTWIYCCHCTDFPCNGFPMLSFMCKALLTLTMLSALWILLHLKNSLSSLSNNARWNIFTKTLSVRRLPSIANKWLSMQLHAPRMDRKWCKLWWSPGEKRSSWDQCTAVDKRTWEVSASQPGLPGWPAACESCKLSTQLPIIDPSTSLDWHNYGPLHCWQHLY